MTWLPPVATSPVAGSGFSHETSLNGWMVP
jgi:hypothetical protein